MSAQSPTELSREIWKRAAVPVAVEEGERMETLSRDARAAVTWSALRTYANLKVFVAPGEMVSNLKPRLSPVSAIGALASVNFCQE